MKRISGLWKLVAAMAAIVGGLTLAFADGPKEPPPPATQQPSSGDPFAGPETPTNPHPFPPPAEMPSQKKAAEKPSQQLFPLTAPPTSQQSAAPHGNGESPPKIAAPVAFTCKDSARKGWKVVIPGDNPLATPAVVDGKLFIGGGFGSYEFYAFNAKTGKLLWQYQTSDDGPTAAVVDAGYVAFNTESCELEILTTDGKPVWKKWLGDPLMSMPAIADGRLMMAFPDSRGDHEHYLACLELKTGKELWRKKIAGEIITAPLIDDEQVFLATLDGTLYCFHAKDGALAWVDKEKNATSAPTVWQSRCWFSRRQETTATKAGKKVTQQTEQVAVRGLEAKAKVRDLTATTRLADYLDYDKRSGGAMGGAMGGMGGSAKESANQKSDAGVGFSGGGIGVDENNKPVPHLPAASQPPISSDKKPTLAPESGSAANAAPQPPKSSSEKAPIYSGGKGDAKIDQAQSNLGQGSVNGVWSYQGSKPLFYEGRLYAAMGDSLLCVDPKTEKVIWKKTFRPDAKKPEAKRPETKTKDKKSNSQEEQGDEEELLDATVTPPALVNHKVFVGTANGEVACLSAATGKVLWEETIDGSIGFQPVVADGRVYVSTESGVLYCIETGDPKDDGWLMWGANAAHTGIARIRK